MTVRLLPWLYSALYLSIKSLATSFGNIDSSRCSWSLCCCSSRFSLCAFVAASLFCCALMILLFENIFLCVGTERRECQWTGFLSKKEIGKYSFQGLPIGRFQQGADDDHGERDRNEHGEGRGDYPLDMRNVTWHYAFIGSVNKGEREGEDRPPELV